jgi:transcriptional regulator with XRE-family HTH domain
MAVAVLEQAPRRTKGHHPALMADGANTNTMSFWLAQAARQIREAADVKQVEIAARMGRTDQSTVYRFEEGNRYSRDLDLMIAAYAEECGVGDPRGIWALAHELWMEHGRAPSVDELRPAGPTHATGDVLEEARKRFKKSLTDGAAAAKPAKANGRRRSTGS